MQTIHHEFITVEEYLVGEQIAEERHDYVNGQVFVMTGATEAEGVSGDRQSSAKHALCTARPPERAALEPLAARPKARSVPI